MVEHTPVVFLYDRKHRKPVGRQCQHCGMILTLAGNLSPSHGFKFSKNDLKRMAGVSSSELSDA